MRLAAIVLVGIVGVASPALAQGLETGWRVQFYRDTFEETVFPVAVVQEIGEDIGPAALGVVCNGSAGLAATFSPSGISFTQEAISVAFRLPSGLRTFRFEPKQVPNFGGRRIADADESSALIAALTEGPSPIPFRTGQKQGQIPTTGADKAIQTLRGFCPEKGR